MTYDLQQLGPTGFQDLAAALSIAAFGPGVQAMGVGRDGGRDMYFDGPLSWGAATEDLAAEVWDGYTVFQVKHKRSLSVRPKDDASWLWGEVRTELDEWSNAPGRARVPDYLVVITNVALTPTPESGGHDQLLQNIFDYVEKLEDGSRDVNRTATQQRLHRLRRLRRIKKVRIWDHNQIQALLTRYREVRTSFSGFLTAADVFEAMAERTDVVSFAELEPVLRQHARRTLVGEGQVYFDEAGSGDGRGIPVHDVAIDLPSTNLQGERSTVTRYVLQRAEHILRPSQSTTPGPRHLIVTGAPGNGKTTIAKLLVQVFRSSLLHGSAELSSEHRSAIDGYDLALRRLHVSMPRHRRWPMRVDLAEYAQEGGLSEDSTLMRWIAEKISKRSNAGTVRASSLQTWMKLWPWLLVLDGLDEVTEPDTRKRLIRQVVEFVNDAEADDCDVLVVLTTRPMGYTENIAPTQFERIDLDDLALDEAVRYGELATRVRLRGDLERTERVIARLRAAADDESLINLLRTPLQVLILTIILEGSGQLAPDRYSLFRGYYDTVFRREQAKPAGLHGLLQNYSHQIQRLHERVGFELQVRSESAERAYATLTAAELRNIIWQILHDDGFNPSGRDSALSNQIFDSATKRLVLLAPRGNDDGYGFDVRSLQELMAAMYLISGPPETVTERLRKALASPHWRNTWIFAAGGLFATPQNHLHRAVVELVETADVSAAHRLGAAVPVGPRLALDIIDDGMARSLPRWRDRLVASALRVLHEPSGDDLPALAKILFRFATTGEEPRRLIADGIRDALSGDEIARQTGRRLQELVPTLTHELRLGRSVRGLTGVRRRPDRSLPPDPVGGWQEFRSQLSRSVIAPANAPALERATAALVRMSRLGRADDVDVECITSALRLHDVSEALDAALSSVTAQEPDIVRALRSQVLPVLVREPVGEQLLAESDLIN